MVDKSEYKGRCGSCDETTDNVWQGCVYCRYLRCEVYVNSLKCEHGKLLDEIL